MFSCNFYRSITPLQKRISSCRMQSTVPQTKPLEFPCEHSQLFLVKSHCDLPDYCVTLYEKHRLNAQKCREHVMTHEFLDIISLLTYQLPPCPARLPSTKLGSLRGPAAPPGTSEAGLNCAATMNSQPLTSACSTNTFQ